MSSADQDEKTKVPGLEHEKGSEAADEDQEKADAQLRAEVERLETAVGALEGEIAADIETLDASVTGDVDSAYFTAQAKARAELERVATSARSVLSNFLGKVADIFYHKPKEVVQDFMAAQEAKALAIPDNPVIIEQITDEITAIFKIISDPKKIKKIEHELQQSFLGVPEKDFHEALRKNGVIGREFKAKLYDEEVKKIANNALRLYNAVAKKDFTLWKQPAALLTSQIWPIVNLETQTGGPQKLVEWWKKLGTLKEAWSSDTSAQTILYNLTSAYREAYTIDPNSANKVVRDDFFEHAQATQDFVNSTTENLAGAPELQTLLNIRRAYILESEVNNRLEKELLSVLSRQRLNVWSDLDPGVREFIIRDLRVEHIYLPASNVKAAWRLILAHPEAARLSKECVEYITGRHYRFVKDFINFKKNDLAELACVAGQEDYAMAYESYSLDPVVGVNLIDYVRKMPTAEAAKFVRSYGDRLPWVFVKDPIFLRTVCGFTDIEISLLTVASFRNTDVTVIFENTDTLDTFTVKALLEDRGVFQNDLSNLGLFNLVLAKHDRTDSATILALMKEKDPYTLMHVCAPALSSSADVVASVALFKQVPGLLHEIAGALMGGLINNYGDLRDLQNPQFVLENYQILGVLPAEVGGLIHQAHHIRAENLNPLLLAYAEDPALVTTPEYELLLAKADYYFLITNYRKLGLTEDALVGRIIECSGGGKYTEPLAALLEAYTHGKVPLAENQIVNILSHLNFRFDELRKLYKNKKNSTGIAAAIRTHYTASDKVPRSDDNTNDKNQELDQSLSVYFDFVDSGQNRFVHEKIVEYLTKNPQQVNEVVAVLGDGKVWGDTRHSIPVMVDILLRSINNASARKSFQVYNRFVENNTPNSLCLLDLRLLERITTQPERTQMTVEVLTECLPLVTKPAVLDLIVNKLDQLIEIPASKRLVYIEVLESVVNSPSQEVQRILEPILRMLLEVENPKESYRKIESIFIKNNLPLVGKVYKIFEILFSADRLEQTLQTNQHLSPYLKAAGHKKRMQTIYADLLRVHVDSDNRSLRHYLSVLKAGESACALLDNETKEISALELKKIKHFIAKLSTLFANSQLAGAGDFGLPEDDMTAAQARTVYQQIRTSLGVKEGQKTTDRVAELFLRPLGFQSVGEALNAMKNKKNIADARGREYVLNAGSGYFSIGKSDLLKGVDARYIDSILQNGSVAKEYLGASSSSDLTPFDTDLVMMDVVQTNRPDAFKKAVQGMVVGNYGDLILVIKDRGQWQITKAGTKVDYSQKKYELFESGVVSSNHYGIRTGFASTEVDYIICVKDSEQNKLFSEIVKNGYFIPVVDVSGKILFTPQMYDEARRAFAGIEYYDGGKYILEPTTDFDPQWADVQAVKKDLPKMMEDVAAISSTIRTKLERILSEQGIRLKEKFDTSLLGAELLDTGSTGRHTNTAEHIDFDLVLKLDVVDESKVATIAHALRDIFKPTKDESHSGDGAADMYQLRFFGVPGIGAKSVDIDIAFVKKSDLSVYGSHDAVRDKLDDIKTNFGDDEYKTVLANIITAKNMLKKANAYKKGAHAEGGLGGIGVENWVLAHGGNLARACEAFQAAAFEGGRQRTLAEFKKVYQINDPGVNAKFLKHDNFVELLTNEGYTRMLTAIEVYCKTS